MGWGNAGWVSDDGWYLNKPSGGGGGYVGPFDINGAARAWGGLRAYSAAYATALGAAIDLVDQSQANAITINVKSDGTLDVASIATWIAAHSVTTAFIKKVYDQTANGFDWSAGVGNQPSLVLSGLGTRPIMHFTNSGSMPSATTITQAQSNTMSAVARRNSINNGGLDSIMCGGAAGQAFGWSATTGNMTIYAGSFAIAPATEVVFHASQALFNGASSSLYIDGSLTSSLNPGSPGLAAETMVLGGIGGNLCIADICEYGLWAGDKTANNSAMNSNQRTYWGF